MQYLPIMIYIGVKVKFFGQKMDLELQKKELAKQALDFIHPGMCIGLGSGSTSKAFVFELSQKKNLLGQIQCIATSIDTEKWASEQGILTLPFSKRVGKIDLVIDGVDAYDSVGNMIKGGGGALFREKRLHYEGQKSLILADSSKKVDSLTDFGFVPIDIVPSAYEYVMQDLSQKFETIYKVKLRTDAQDKPFVTDDGSWVLDISFSSINDLKGIDHGIKAICGVIETGLFIDLKPKILSY